MEENRTLDDFLSGDSDAEGDAENVGDASDVDADASDPTESDEGDAEADVEVVDPEEVSPVVATYQWSPEGAACAECGETVETRWLADAESETAAYVCEACKEW